MTRGDLGTPHDVALLIDAFYDQVFADPLIGPIFTEVAKVDMRAHAPIMCDFWTTVLFRSGSYRRNAFAAHRALHTRHRLSPAHFARWLALWTATIDARFAGPIAEHAKTQAERIAASMSKRLNASDCPVSVGVTAGSAVRSSSRAPGRAAP